VGAAGWRARVLFDSGRAASDAKQARAALAEAHTVAAQLGHTALARAAEEALADPAARR
jgi:hypothetical protein